jgi:hypothetical protein
MAIHFTGAIEIGYNTDLWGPYLFKFPITSGEDENDGLIPYGDTIDSVTARTFQGKVTNKSTLSEETEITDLVDPAFPPNIELGYKVWVKFQYPIVTSFKGSKATLIFEVTLTSTGTKSFYHQYVYVR